MRKYLEESLVRMASQEDVVIDLLTLYIDLEIMQFLNRKLFQQLVLQEHLKLDNKH
jgi:hypothetical protein